MPKGFDPAVCEAGRDAVWQAHLAAQRAAAPSSGSPYTILFPPPNVTGALHIGHALTATIQDALVRWRRMRGDRVLFIPGLDHAGIATQTVVEKRLKVDRGLSRHDLGRDEFIAEVRQWSAQYGDRIRTQLKRLGASFDWDHEYFTLDAPRSAAVTEAFVRLAQGGLVYRQRRFVNWCPALRTALSDIECNTLQLEGPTKVPVPGRKTPVEFGLLHTFGYPLETPLARAGGAFPAPPVEAAGAAGGDAAPAAGAPAAAPTYTPLPSAANGVTHIFVSTTRPETMLGDAAVAVHPDDPRYKHLIGSMVLHPITGKRIPIVGDATLADPTLGTGAVKVTPAHDVNDHGCALRHGLPVVPLMDEAGRIMMPGVEPAGPAAAAGGSDAAAFHGLDRYDARFKVLATLKQRGLYHAAAKHPMALAVCSRSGDVLEPMLMPQWYVNVTGAAALPKPPQEGVAAGAGASIPAAAAAAPGMATAAAAAARSRSLAIHPSANTGEWYRWLDHAVDWCVSRQLWWGHRIPAWRVAPAASARRNAAGVDASAGAPWVSSQGVTLVTDTDGAWIIARSEEDARVHARAWLQAATGGPGVGAAAAAAEDDVSLVRDDDVLDTWFSSGLLPLSALGWPHANAADASTSTSAAASESSGARGLPPALTQHYPLSLMETGSDILFFWVARMVMLCSNLAGGSPQAATAAANTAGSASVPPIAPPTDALLPFKSVFLHPVVRDKTGRKMSKSLGNVIDPMAVMDGVTLAGMVEALAAGNLDAAEVKRATAALKKDFPHGIPACGADALRLSMALFMKGHSGAAEGTIGAGINADTGRIHQARLFCNKVWNASRFVLGYSHLVTESSEWQAAAAALAASSAVAPAPLLPATAAGAAAAPVDAALVALPLQLSIADVWILQRLRGMVHAVNASLERLDIGGAAAAVHDFFLGDFCDVYVEWAKTPLAGHALQQPVAAAAGAPAATAAAAAAEPPSPRARTVALILHHVLDVSLRAFHPFMPFVTDDLSGRLAAALESVPLAASGSVAQAALADASLQRATLLAAPFPVADTAACTGATAAADAEPVFASLLAIVDAGRSLRKLMLDVLQGTATTAAGGDLKAALQYTVAVRPPATDASKALLAALADNLPAMATQFGASAATVHVQQAPVDGSAAARLTTSAGPAIDVSLAFPPGAEVSGAIDREVGRLEKRREKVQADTGKLQARMAGASYAGTVPTDVQAADAQQAAALQAELASLGSTVEQLRAAREQVVAAATPR